MNSPVKLHIGGKDPHPDWKIFNVVPAPEVDFIGNCTDLSLFGDNTVDEVYASHVLEHLIAQDIHKAMHEVYRILKPGGLFKVSVPDISVLCKLYLESTDTPRDQVRVVGMIYGGHADEYDIHHFGFNYKILASMLLEASFSIVTPVQKFEDFHDSSVIEFRGVQISLNVIATK